LIVVVFFAGFLAYTFVARQHLESRARSFVAEKTLEFSRPIVAVADVALGSPLVKKALSDDQIAAIRHEILDYQNDPAAYIADLTRQNLRDAPVANANPLIDRVVSMKRKIRLFYDNTLNALIVDLRVFSTSNLIAALIAFYLAYRSSHEIRKPIVWFSFLMFVAVLYCSYLYYDGLTFFHILFRAHIGWWYAAVLCITIVALFLNYGRQANCTEQRDAHGKSST
jgi:hypothetical protein